MMHPMSEIYVTYKLAEHRPEPTRLDISGVPSRQAIAFWRRRMDSRLAHRPRR